MKFSLKSMEVDDVLFGDMDVLERYYGKGTFNLYGLFAVVPGRKSWPRKVFIFVTAVLLLIVMIFQTLKFVTDGCTLPLMVDILPSLSAIIAVFLYLLYVTTATDVEYKRLLVAMWHDLNEERIEAEDAIKRRYAVGARLFMNIYLVILVITVCGMSSAGFVPIFLDLIAPLNETRQKQLLYNGELFIDQQKYFYELYIVEVCMTACVGVIIVGSENMAVIVLQHLCGMIAIVGYQLENLTKAKEQFYLKNIDYVEMVSNRLRICIDEHIKSLHFAGLVATFYDIPVTFIMIGSFCTLTISLVQVTDPQLISLKMVVYTSGQFFQFLLLSWLGQIEIDASEGIAGRAYNAEWDVCPPNARRILQLVILRCSRPSEIVARRMYTLSIENFMSVIETVTSFYMVIRKAQ